MIVKGPGIVFPAVCILLILSSFIFAFAELKYPQGSSFVEVPDPLSGENPRLVRAALKEPKPGETYRDPLFGTIITRITTASPETGRHEYSRFDPFNANKTFVILGPEKWQVYSTSHLPCNTGRPVMSLDDCGEPRWDPLDPDIIWYTTEKALYRLQLPSGKRLLVKDFAKDPALKAILAEKRVWRITMKDEGEASLDNRYWAFFIQGGESVDYRILHLFTWDREKDQVTGIYRVGPKEADLDWIGMSPKGNWVLIGGAEYNEGKLQGMTIADKSLKKFHRIDFATAHSDVALDVNGREVLIMQNARTDYIDMIPLSWDTKPVLESGGSYAGTGRIPLVRLFYSSESPYNLNSGVHMSGNFPGYCVISTQLEMGEKGNNWLDNVLLLVRLDPEKPRAFYLAQNFTLRKEYWEESHATITRDGARVLWATNWAKNAGKNRCFLMSLDMPPSWPKMMKQ